MAELERDPHTGYLTTGHEWNGIKELNSPVPWPVWFFIMVTHVWALIYWVLMPSWPLLTTYTKGLLGADDRAELARELEQAAAGRQAWVQRVADGRAEDLLRDEGIMRRVRDTGHALFGDNCASCHGREARGAQRFPDLTSQSWLWGGTPEAVAETIRVGINSQHPQSRVSQMAAFGRDGMLDLSAVRKVVTFVQSLSGTQNLAASTVQEGAAIFEQNCAPCHGPTAKGNTDVGAPDLTSGRWIYGSDAESLFQTVWGGRRGYMPSWEGRLAPVDQKILALYLVDLRAKR